MKKEILFIVLISFSLGLSAQVIVADHSIVDDYDIIPQRYIDSVKKMRVTLPGESHSSGYRKGLQFLETEDARFQVSIQEDGTPETATDQNLRFSRGTWGDVSHSSGWIYNYGEEDWYTSSAAIEATKAGILYSNNNGFDLAATGFGWCWDMSWVNDPGGTIDPVYQVRWAGSSSGGPDGNLRWGLDSDDAALTGNSVNMDSYLTSMEEYISFCEVNNLPTVVFFTTGPVDANSFNSGENGYQRSIKTDYIRNYVDQRGDGFLFDYADILCWNNDGEQHTITWTDHGGTLQEFEFIHPDNMTDLDGSYDEDGDHIGQVGTVRIAKAMWWMLARMAGWDGLPETTSDTEAPSVPSNLAFSVTDESTVSLNWSASTDNVGVIGYNIYRDGSLLINVGTTTYSDTPLDGEQDYIYTISALDAAGNESAVSSSITVNTFNELGLARMQCSFITGYNWFSVNVANSDMSVSSILPFVNTSGDYLKNQMASSTYYEGYGWFGTLSEIDPKELYMLRVSTDCELDFVGTVMDPADNSIQLFEGWNWISYIPSEPLALEDAFSTYGLSDMDYIKDQTSSATYYEGSGWFGTLNELKPGMGYIMRVSAAGMLTYPEATIAKKSLKSSMKNQLEEHVNIHNFEFNGSMTAELSPGQNIQVVEEDILLAYVGDECRGASNGLYFDPSGKVLFPIMLYSNLAEGESMTFKFYDASEETYYDLKESVSFIDNMVIAEAYDAFAFSLTDEVSNKENLYRDDMVKAYPNPFNTDLQIRINTGLGGILKMTDISGRTVLDKTIEPCTGEHESFIISTGDLNPGVYILQFKSAGINYTQEMIKL